MTHGCSCGFFCSSANKAGNREGPGDGNYFFWIGRSKFLQNFMQDGLILVVNLRMFHLPEIKIDVRNNKPIETPTGKACTNVKHLNQQQQQQSL